MESEESLIAVPIPVSEVGPSVPSPAYPSNYWVNWQIHNSLMNIQSLPESKYVTSSDDDIAKLPKKRGRRPLRPFDPIKKKTEEKDKYWLRSFRSFMKFNYPKIEHTLSNQDKVFLQEYLSPRGKPDKGNKFLSYGKKYKDYLFSHQIFVDQYREWFKSYGQAELSKKCKVGSDLWFVYYDYASKDLFSYSVSKKTEDEHKESEDLLLAKLEENPMMQVIGYYYITAFLRFFENNNANKNNSS
mmetsp:Transcript_16738/g.16644  ORF Transcript_16738/g.16644 Transcript_16738/m.16644 type:complete len:243 (+) Transcript_16738:5-733(+)